MTACDFGMTACSEWNHETLRFDIIFYIRFFFFTSPITICSYTNTLTAYSVISAMNNATITACDVSGSFNTLSADVVRIASSKDTDITVCSRDSITG